MLYKACHTSGHTMSFAMYTLLSVSLIVPKQTHLLPSTTLLRLILYLVVHYPNIGWIHRRTFIVSLLHRIQHTISVSVIHICKDEFDRIYHSGIFRGRCMQATRRRASPQGSAAFCRALRNSSTWIWRRRTPCHKGRIEFSRNNDALTITGDFKFCMSPIETTTSLSL